MNSSLYLLYRVTRSVLSTNKALYSFESLESFFIVSFLAFIESKSARVEAFNAKAALSFSAVAICGRVKLYVWKESFVRRGTLWAEELCGLITYVRFANFTSREYPQNGENSNSLQILLFDDERSIDLKCLILKASRTLTWMTT
jgi:hypothetical protein